MLPPPLNLIKSGTPFQSAGCWFSVVRVTCEPAVSLFQHGGRSDKREFTKCEPFKELTRPQSRSRGNLRGQQGEGKDADYI